LIIWEMDFWKPVTSNTQTFCCCVFKWLYQFQNQKNHSILKYQWFKLENHFKYEHLFMFCPVIEFLWSFIFPKFSKLSSFQDMVYNPDHSSLGLFWSIQNVD
jgi:hypothetical protein